jgi:hypothetical protein
MNAATQWILKNCRFAKSNSGLGSSRHQYEIQNMLGRHVEGLHKLNQAEMLSLLSALLGYADKIRNMAAEKNIAEPALSQTALNRWIGRHCKFAQSDDDGHLPLSDEAIAEAELAAMLEIDPEGTGIERLLPEERKRLLDAIGKALDKKKRPAASPMPLKDILRNLPPNLMTKFVEKKAEATRPSSASERDIDRSLDELGERQIYLNELERMLNRTPEQMGLERLTNKNLETMTDGLLDFMDSIRAKMLLPPESKSELTKEQTANWISKNCLFARKSASLSPPNRPAQPVRQKTDKTFNLSQSLCLHGTFDAARQPVEK